MIQGDSITPALIPKDINGAALYFNGLFAANVAKWKDHWPRVLWIDVNAAAPEHCSILDIETGDATTNEIRPWVQARARAVPDTLIRLYCNLSMWPSVKAEVAQLNTDLRQRVRYWVANPTGNPHIVPGSSCTQYMFGANYDLSEYNTSW